ncbi:helix-turn-helix domain-containing protein [Actinoplanes aureus]|nr:helix-turn-helix transcriptional regulator [Actinoplanes aureus]
MANTSRLPRLAWELRRLRLASGLSLHEAEKRLGLYASSINRIERAVHQPQRRTVNLLLDAYGVTDPQQRAIVLSWLKPSGDDWVSEHEPYLSEHYSTYIRLEDSAERVRTHESQFVPGLLQTEAYARAAIGGADPDLAPDEVERLVRVRLQRQQVLTRPAPPRLWAVLDEAVIRREVGGVGVMREQLHRLAEAASAAHVTVQVLPFGAGAHPGMNGSLTVMDLGAPFGSTLAVTDSMTGDTLIHETAELARLATTFERIAAQALDPAASATLIADATA